MQEEKNSIINDGLAIMSEPTGGNEIEWKFQAKSKDGKTAVFVPYIDARALYKRLTRAFGAYWSKNTDYLGKIDHKSGECMFKTTIVVSEGMNSVSRDGYASATDVEPTKGGESDSFKRAGTMFGFGIDLYEYPDVSVQLNEAGYPPFKLKDAFNKIHYAVASGMVTSEDRLYVNDKQQVFFMEYGKPGKEIIVSKVKVKKDEPEQTATDTDWIDKLTLTEVTKGLYMGNGSVKNSDLDKVVQNWVTNGGILLYQIHIYTINNGKKYFWKLDEFQMKKIESFIINRHG